MNIHNIVDEQIKENQENERLKSQGILGTKTEVDKQNIEAFDRLNREQHAQWLGLERTTKFFKQIEEQIEGIDKRILTLIEQADPKEDYALRKLLVEQTTLKRLIENTVTTLK